MIHISVMKST